MFVTTKNIIYTKSGKGNNVEPIPFNLTHNSQTIKYL